MIGPFSLGPLPLRRAPLLLILTLLLVSATGCNLVVAGGVLASRIIPQKVDAQYKGLAGESVAVMVWCERGVRIDYPTIQLDCATGVQNKLRQAQESGVKELKLTNFPVQPASIARYQAQYPQTQSLPITEVAPHLANKTGLTRLIYIEIEGFATRPSPGVELFRGSMVGSIKVLEITEDGAVTVVDKAPLPSTPQPIPPTTQPKKRARTVYEETDVHTVFPKKSPEEGTPNANDSRIYAGTLDSFTTEVAKRFFTHDLEEE